MEARVFLDAERYAKATVEGGAIYGTSTELWSRKDITGGVLFDAEGFQKGMEDFELFVEEAIRIHEAKAGDRISYCVIVGDSGGQMGSVDSFCFPVGRGEDLLSIFETVTEEDLSEIEIRSFEENIEILTQAEEMEEGGLFHIYLMPACEEAHCFSGGEFNPLETRLAIEAGRLQLLSDEVASVFMGTSKEALRFW